MQLFIGGITKSLSYDDLYEHFSRYGRIQSLKIIDTYGFVTYDRREDSYFALSAKHYLRGIDLILEEAHRKRDDREDLRGRMSPPGRGLERHASSPPRRCDYCDRCPVHGSITSVRPRREIEHPGDKYKIVLMGIPPEVEEDDVKEFARSFGFDPVFVRITRNKKFGIIEFNNHDEKEEALRKLDNRELMGSVVQVREYKSGSDLREDERVKRSRFDDEYDSRRQRRGDDDRRGYSDVRRRYEDDDRRRRDDFDDSRKRPEENRRNRDDERRQNDERRGSDERQPDERRRNDERRQTDERRESDERDQGEVSEQSHRKEEVSSVEEEKIVKKEGDVDGVYDDL